MKKYGIVFLFVCQLLFGWGSTGHKIINKGAVTHLPVSMKQFIDAAAFLETHSTDADTRKNTSDTTMFSEQYRHYLDVDEYPDFRNLDRSFSKLVSTYGWARVKFNGTNPWATVQWMDSLTEQLRRGNWNAAYQSAADLGHYVGDPHQPLHATENYDGKMTGNTGIHSRYESTMLGKYTAQIIIAKDSVRYISDVYGIAFDYILKSNALCDSIFRADTEAKTYTGGSYTTQYYDTLWKRLGAMTKAQIQSASIDLASLWYTAWVNAGLISLPASVSTISISAPGTFRLHQNFPNPFNPSTTIAFDVARPGVVAVEIFSLEGKLIATVVQREFEAGSYRADWDASRFSSGVYVCRMTAGNTILTRKLLFVK
jgi:hypothetical protein